MANKQMSFSAKLDDREFLSALKKIQDKVKELYSPTSSNVAFNAAQDKMRKLGIIGPSREEEERTKRFNDLQKKSQTELTQIILEQHKAYQEIDKEIKQKIDRVESLKKKEENLKTNSEEHLKVKEKIKDIESEILNKIDKQNEASENLKNTVNALEQKKEIFTKGLVGSLGAIAAIAETIQKINAFKFESVKFDLATRAAVGTVASEGPGGELLSSMYQGKTSNYMFFQPERLKALSQAQKHFDSNQQRYSKENITAGFTESAIFGGLAGVAGGAMLGPAAPVTSTVGAALGAAGAAGTYLLSDPKRIKAFTDPEGVKAQLMAESVEQYRKSLEDEKKINPVETLARENYENAKERNFKFQRMLGLSDESFYGKKGVSGSGFLGKTEKGYTQEELFGTAQEIVGSGGSTRSAINNVETAIKMQRAGIQNASGIIGQLSRTIGDAKTTESATIRVLEAGVAKGLDKSEFRQENNKFIEIVARSVALSGATTEAGAKSLSAYAGDFLTGKTMASVEAIPNAMAFIKSMQTSSGTPESVIKASKIMSSEDFKELPMMMKEEIAYGDPNQLMDPQNAKTIAIAQAMSTDENKITPEQFVEKYKELNKDVVASTKPVQEMLDKVRERRKTLEKEGKTEEEAFKQVKKEGLVGAAEMGLGFEKQERFRNLSAEEQEAVISYATSEKGKGKSLEEAAKAVGVNLSKASGEQKLGNLEQEAIARTQSILNDEFKEMKNKMDDAASSAARLTKEFLNSALKMEEAAKQLEKTSSTPGLWSKVFDQYEILGMHPFRSSSKGTDFTDIFSNEKKVTAGPNRPK